MNNGKKYLIIGVAILFILIILVAVLQKAFTKGPANPVPTGQLIPTPIGGRQGNTYKGPSQGSGRTPFTSQTVITEKQKKDLITKLPIETDDYIISYSAVMDKIVVTRRTPEAETNLSVWADESGYADVLSDYHNTLVTDQTVEEIDAVLGGPTKSIMQKSQEQTDQLLELASLIVNLPNLYSNKVDELKEEIKNRPTPTSTPAPTPTNTPVSPGEPKTYDGYVYYSQCRGQYDSYPLTSGCTLCKAGCGPTTVSMVLSTYVDKKYTPPYVVEIYRDLGAAACGTRLDIAKRVLSSHGVKTTDYIIPYTGTRHDVKDVDDDLREYINNGWTIFVLATYQLSNGSWGGHYFWMTDISASGNVMAFDPYYGMSQTPPINENRYYPSPKYLAAFGVKKQ